MRWRRDPDDLSDLSDEVRTIAGFLMEMDAKLDRILNALGEEDDDEED